MSRTESFRTQHKELAALIGEIEGKLGGLNAESAAEVRKTLSALSGKLSIHLAMEDKNLYPLMTGSSNEKAKQTAQEFMTEMGGLAQAFKDYTAKWPSADVIMEDPSGFSTQTRAVFKAVKDRVTREESILYALADTL